jgi:hypothetical protein
VARPRAARPQRDRLLVAPPRRIQRPVSEANGPPRSPNHECATPDRQSVAESENSARHRAPTGPLSVNPGTLFRPH